MRILSSIFVLLLLPFSTLVEPSVASADSNLWKGGTKVDPLTDATNYYAAFRTKRGSTLIITCQVQTNGESRYWANANISDGLYEFNNSGLIDVWWRKDGFPVNSQQWDLLKGHLMYTQDGDARWFATAVYESEVSLALANSIATVEIPTLSAGARQALTEVLRQCGDGDLLFY